MATIAEILLEQGRQAAEARRQQGAQSAATWTNLGNLIGSLPQQYQQAKDQQQAQAVRGIQLKNAQDVQAGNQAVDRLMAPPAPVQGPTDPSTGQGPIQGQNEYLDADGLWNIPKLTQALGASGKGHLAPELLKPAEAINDSITKHRQLEQQIGQQHTILLGDLADGALKLSKSGGMPIPDAMDFVVQPALATKRIDPNEYAKVKERISALPPEQQAAALKNYMDQAELVAPQETLADKARRTGRYGTVFAENVGNEKPTEASLAYDLTDPDPAKRARAQFAMRALKEKDVKPGTPEDFVLRARSMAETQKGAPLTPNEIQAVDAKTVAAYKNLTKDPDAAALAQSNAELRNLMLRSQLDQQPTADDAKTIAKQLVDHKMAPSQLSLFGGFGAAGAAFKRMVGTEALKLDPNFDMEQSESDYQFAKSPTFQNTIRYIDSTLESMPRLLDNFKALANGNVKSINAMVNQGKAQVNNVDLKKAQTDAIFVGDEIAKILQGGGTGSGTSDAKLKQAQDVFSTSDNPAAIAGALQEVQALMGNRRSALTKGTYLERQSAAEKTDAKTPPPQLPPGASVSRSK